ncbi:MAG TPA: F0F1 ATP synthase subunit B' [Acetobacteraceae bacterium]
MRPVAAFARTALANIRMPAIAAAGFLLTSSTGFAEDQPKGMPQLDFSNPLTISQVVWLVLIFLTLYVLLAKWALPQVSEVLAARAATIERDLDAARDAKAEADAAVAELTAATRQAQASAQAEIDSAVAAARKDAADQAAAANARLQAQLAAAEAQIAAARASALGALRQVATDTASVVVNRLTGMTPDTQAVDAAVGTALAARSQG